MEKIRQVFRVEITSNKHDKTNCNEVLECIKDVYIGNQRVIVEKHLEDEFIQYDEYNIEI